MKNIIISIITFCLLSSQLFAASARQEVEKLKRELELDLQEHLTSSLKQRYGLDQVMVSAEIKLDETGLMRSWGVEQEAIPFEGSLPGFASSGYDAQVLKVTTVNEARGFIQKLGLKIHTFSEDYDRTQLEKFVSLLAANYAKVSEQKITVQSDATSFQFRKAKPQAAPAPVKSETISDFVRRHWEQFAFGALAIFGLLLLTHTLRSGFKNIGRNLASPSSGVSAVSGGDRHTLASGSVTLNDSVSEKSMMNLLAIRGELEQLGKKHPLELEGLLLIKAELGELREAMMLLECVEPAQRELTLHRLMKIDGIDKDTFLAKLSQDMLQNYQQTPAQTANLLRLFKLVLLSPSSMRKITLLDTINNLASADLLQLYRTCSEGERKFLQMYLPESSVGYLMSQVKFISGDAADASTNSEEGILLEMTKSIGSFRRSVSQKRDTERTLRIYAQMPFTEAEAYADQAEIPAYLRLPTLYANYKTAGQNFVKTLSFEKMSALIAALEPELRHDVSEALPEILRERLKFVRQSGASAERRGEFYFYLYQIHQESSRDPVAPVELKAA